MKKPLTLSIVIPAYNEENYLETCLKAIAAQTIMPDEVIVVDNNSTDATVVVAQQFAFVKVVHETQQGIVFGRDAGFNAATSDIIGRIDADTLLDADWVGSVKRFFGDNPGTQAVTGECYFYDFPASKLIHKLHAAVYYSSQSVIAGTMVLWGSNMALRRSAWTEVKAEVHKTNDIDEDIDLSLVLYRKGLLIERSSELLAEVSMRRGDLGPASVMKYLHGWPLVYRVNNMPFKAGVINCLQAGLLIFTLPVSALYMVINKTQMGLKKIYAHIPQ